MHTRLTLLTLLLVPAAAVSGAGWFRPAGEPKAPTGQRPVSADDDAPVGATARDAAAALRKTVQRHLRDNRIEAALKAAQDALDRFPRDAEVRDEFIDLHLALARTMLAEERFDVVLQALAAIERVDPDHPLVRRWRSAIDKARSEAPVAVARARDWIDLEWFEPAFNTLRQAIALRPDRRDEYLASLRKAALGAGDDEYLTKNFHEAFYFYDAAVRLDDERGRSSPDDLLSRWMQSMAHALSRDVDVARYPPGYWTMVLRRADNIALEGPQTDIIRAMLRGMASENLGELDEAASQYARITGARAAAGAAAVARARSQAVARVRALYDPELTGRRESFWSQHEAGDWQLLERAPFRVHHRNHKAARRLERAARFQLARVARLCGLDAAEVRFDVPCDIYLHADGEAFAAATGQSADVRAVSRIRQRGDRLVSLAIHVHQADLLLLSASLPHELAHLVFAARLGPEAANAIPPALREGFALGTEPACRRRQFARVFAGLERPRPLRSLLAVDELHPPEPAFYAESARLLNVLEEKMGLPRLLEALADAARSDDAAENAQPVSAAVLAKMAGYVSPKALESAYRGEKVNSGRAPPSPRP